MLAYKTLPYPLKAAQALGHRYMPYDRNYTNATRVSLLIREKGTGRKCREEHSNR